MRAPIFDVVTVDSIRELCHALRHRRAALISAHERGFARIHLMPEVNDHHQRWWLGGFARGLTDPSEIYARESVKRVPWFRPRHVDAKVSEEEAAQRARWHEEQAAVEIESTLVEESNIFPPQPRDNG